MALLVAINRPNQGGLRGMAKRKRYVELVPKWLNRIPEDELREIDARFEMLWAEAEAKGEIPQFLLEGKKPAKIEPMPKTFSAQDRVWARQMGIKLN
jgi:hypothetical protein